MKINTVIYYEQAFYSATINYEDLICICVLIFGICAHHQCSPETLNESDYQLLLILYQPIQNYLKNNTVLDRESIMNIVTRASDKDYDDFSVTSKLPYSSKSSVTETTNNLTDHQDKKEKQLVSDDEMENSFNIPSVTSETSYTSNLANHDGSKISSRHRGTRGFQNTRKGYNVLHLNAPSWCRKNASPKISLELKKQEAKRISNIERDNKILKDDLFQSHVQLEELNLKLGSSEISYKKLKTENQKWKDIIDERDSQIAEKDQILFLKDKEVERMSNFLNQLRKEKQEKIDEIKEKKNTINELHSLIDNLNAKVQLKVNDYDEAKITEIEYLKINENLKNENRELKCQIDEYEEAIQGLRNKDKTNNRDHYAESPVSDYVEIGESMKFINDFKCAEMQENFNKLTENYQTEIKTLKNEIEKNDKTVLNFKSELEVLDGKYNEALSEIKIYSTKLNEVNQELLEAHDTIVENSTVQLPDLKNMRFQSIVELFSELLSDNGLQLDEKKLLAKFIARELNVDLFDDDRLKDEIDSLSKNVNDLKQSNERKIAENERLQNQYDDLEHHFEILSDELETEKMKSDELTRYYQVQKSKLDDDLFKARMTINNVQEEKTKIYDKFCDMKRDYLRSENNLLKSNDEFNATREAYDKCLQKLKQLAEDCHDYEEVIKEITARQQKIYRNVSCQTGTYFATTGTNVMSPRTPNLMNRSQSLKKSDQSRQHYPESLIPRNSPQIELSKNIIANKSLHSLRQVDNTIRSNTHRTPTNKPYQSMIPHDPRLYNKSSETKSYQKHEDQNTFRNKPITNKLIKDENKYSLKKDSPLVKPDRLNQIWSRNDKQPAHLKSSYPVETQGVELGYVASVYFDKMNMPLSDSDVSEVDHDNNITTGRSINSHRFTNVDPLNFRSNMKNRGLYHYNDDVMVDNLLKRNDNAAVLSARSGNSQTADMFKMPSKVPQLKLPGGSDRDSDRENRRPFCDKDDFEETSSVTSRSISFNVANSPKMNCRGFPRGSIRRDLKK